MVFVMISRQHCRYQLFTRIPDRVHLAAAKREPFARSKNGCANETFNISVMRLDLARGVCADSRSANPLGHRRKSSPPKGSQISRSDFVPLSQKIPAK
jgi:hypothetical protein